MIKRNKGEMADDEYVNAHVRFPRDLHETLMRLAADNYLSLNRFVVQTMALRVQEKGPLDK